MKRLGCAGEMRVAGEVTCRGSETRLKEACRMRWVAVSLVLLGVGQVAPAAEPVWEISGELISHEPGPPGKVVLRVTGGQLVTLPVECFSEESLQSVVRHGGRVNGEAAPTPDEKSDLPAELVEDLACCRRAADAYGLCQLYLAGDDVPPATRAAVETLAGEFQERAAGGEVRRGGRWISSDDATRSAGEAEKHIDQAIAMLRLGNARLAEQELREASRLDETSGKAEFLLGMAYANGPRPHYETAAEAFEEVISREPENGPAYHNLAICELQRRRLTQALAGFRQAATRLPDVQPLVGNLAAIIRLSANPASRLPAKRIEGFAELYSELTRGRGVAQPEGLVGLTMLTAAGEPLAGGGLLEMFGSHGGHLVMAGVVVGQEMVAVVDQSGCFDEQAAFTVETRDGSSLPATIAASTDDQRTFLLRCPGLVADAMSLASAEVGKRSEVLVVTPSDQEDAGHEERVGGNGRGFVLAVPAAGQPGDLVYELVEPRGSPGGILFDGAGRVVGFDARQPPCCRSANFRRLAVPGSAVSTMLEEVGLAGEKAAPAEADGWQTVRTRANTAVVRVTCRSAEPALVP